MLKTYLIYIDGNPKESNKENYNILGREELEEAYNPLRAQDK